MFSNVGIARLALLATAASAQRVGMVVPPVICGLQAFG
jgi:hypothetical protein